MIKFATLAAAALLLTGCAGTANTPADNNRAEARNAEVRTGTRLPSRDTSVKTVSGQDYKQDANRTIGDAPRGN